MGGRYADQVIALKVTELNGRQHDADRTGDTLPGDFDVDRAAGRSRIRCLMSETLGVTDRSDGSLAAI
jgi:hypothetical protein